ncbi:MAG: hypothetical protein WCK00_18040 [Deltaproteobacteria bacterium]
MKNLHLNDEFLSEEDLSICEMGDEELEAYWNFWLELAQSTNEEDKELYSHGVFVQYPTTIKNKDLTTIATGKACERGKERKLNRNRSR